MAVQSMDVYNQQATQQYDPQYNAKVTAAKNALATTLNSLDASKTGINANYDTQINANNRGTVKNQNSYSNSTLGRGLGDSTIASTGITEQGLIGKRVNDETNMARTGDLNNIETQKALATSNEGNDLTTLAGDRSSAIATLARQLYGEDWTRNYQQSQLDSDNAYKQKELEYQQQQAANDQAYKMASLASQNSANASDAQYKQALLKLQGQQYGETSASLADAKGAINGIVNDGKSDIGTKMSYLKNYIGMYDGTGNADKQAAVNYAKQQLDSLNKVNSFHNPSPVSSSHSTPVPAGTGMSDGGGFNLGNLLGGLFGVSKSGSNATSISDWLNKSW